MMLLHVSAFASEFTGKERDTESGLDYFGARYYASNMGRWMSPDWASDPQSVPYASYANPQSLNLYSYVLNNPLSHTDADGHCDQNGQNCSTWDHIAGAVGGLLNVVPMTLNIPNRNDLGRNIDFSKQSDREAIGNALINHVRQTGGCDVNGSNQAGCQ
jgi:RHS repeat-associated protein